MIELAHPSECSPPLDGKKLVVNRARASTARPRCALASRVADPGSAWEALATALCAYAVLDEPLPDGPLRRIALEPNGLQNPDGQRDETVDPDDTDNAPQMPDISGQVLFNCCASAWGLAAVSRLTCSQTAAGL